MKFYDCVTAPSPRRVRIFLAEKGLTVPTVQVDLRSGDAWLNQGANLLLFGPPGAGICSRDIGPGKALPFNPGVAFRKASWAA